MRRGGGRGGGGGGSGGYYSSDPSVGNSNPHGGYVASQSPPQMAQINKPDNHPGHNQWRWERDASKVHSPMSPHMLTEGQGNEASRAYLQGHRPDSRVAHGKQDTHDVPRGEAVDAGNDRDPVSQVSFDVIEKKFLDDFKKLSKEQSDAEDAEIARHRETIKAINGKYEEQLVSLRAKHGSRREEILQRESQSRWQQYQQATMDHFPKAGSFGGPNSDPSAPPSRSPYPDPSAPPSRSPYPAADTDYNSYNRDRDHHHFFASSRNHELESRGHYSGGHIHDTRPRYY